jgi:hypothetical protein
VEAEQLGELARLVVPLDHRKFSSIASSQEAGTIAKVSVLLDMRATG